MMNITDTVLAATLKELLADDILDRKQYNENSPRIKYTLTNTGISVIPILQSICQWSGTCHRSDREYDLSQCQKCDYIFR